MYSISNDFSNALRRFDREFLVKAIINGVEYDKSSIVEFTVESNLSTGEGFELGTAIISKLTIALRTINVIPPNAKVAPYLALKLSTGITEWLPMGEFYVDHRKKVKDTWIFTCYDKLVWADVPYISQLTYPATMQAVWDEICTSLGYTYDSSVQINPAYQIQVGPAGYSKRQVLGYIASANSASVFVGRDGMIKFKQFFAADTPVFDMGASDYFHLVQTNPVKTYTRIVVINDDDLSFESGTGDENHTLYVRNPFGTQAIANDLLTKLNGFSYMPVQIEARGFPQLEIGDLIQHDDKSPILRLTYSFKGGLKMSIDSPSKSEQQSEFVVEGTLSAQINKINKEAVKLGKSYYGATLTREEGLTIEREDHSSKVILNSDKQEFTANGVRKIYFDPIEGTYIFDGKLSASIVSALEAEFGTTITNVTITNILSAETGNIAELTVDQLETSDKVQKYLASDTSDINYIRAKDQYIEWVTASTDGLNTEQVVDRSGTPLYWSDSTKTKVTTDTTSWPVLTYVYSEILKRRIGFENVDGVETPIDEFGAGTGTGDNGKFFIRKHSTGVDLEYITTSGVSRKISLDDNGIFFSQPGSVNIEYKRAVYGITTEFTFDNTEGYMYPPVITASLNYDALADNQTARTLTQYDMYPVIDLKIKEINGTLYYTGCWVHWHGNAPLSIPGAYTSIHALCRKV